MTFFIHSIYFVYTFAPSHVLPLLLFTATWEPFMSVMRVFGFKREEVTGGLNDLHREGRLERFAQ